MVIPVLSAVLLLLLPGTLTEYSEPVHIEVHVENRLHDKPALIYPTYVVYRGILLGALMRLNDSNANFSFTYTQDPNYGPYLESVNGVAGSSTENTYWELLVKTSHGKIIIPDVGIGCYIPRAHDNIILNYTKF